MNSFKVGDKVICVDNEGQDDLTLGKSYMVVDRNDRLVTPPDRINIIDDTGSAHWYLPRRFRLATLLEEELANV